MLIVGIKIYIVISLHRIEELKSYLLRNTSLTSFLDELDSEIEKYKDMLAADEE